MNVPIQPDGINGITNTIGAEIMSHIETLISQSIEDNPGLSAEEISSRVLAAMAFIAKHASEKIFAVMLRVCVPGRRNHERR